MSRGVKARAARDAAADFRSELIHWRGREWPDGRHPWATAVRIEEVRDYLAITKRRVRFTPGARRRTK